MAYILVWLYCALYEQLILQKGKRMKTVYISHPYTGNEIENRFDAQHVCAELKEAHPDWCLVNPIDNFLWADDFKLSYDTILGMCIELLRCCDAIYMCKDWDDSKGCCTEKMMAEAAGMEVIYE